MSLFVKEAQPPPGCGRHKWPDSHGPADNRRPCAGFFPSGAVPTRMSGGRAKGSGTSSLSEAPLLTTRGFGRCCPSRLAGARRPSRRGGASLGRRAPGSAGAGQARRHRCRVAAASLCQPRARERRSGRRAESGTRRGGKTSDARPHWSRVPCVSPGALP